MKYFSLFTGAGGFEQGMPKDWECVGFSEIDKYANMVLRHHWPDVINYGDIARIEWEKVPDFDLLVGGSPCQDLSLAGKRKGLKGERSGLFFEYVKALGRKKPDYFIWENVAGSLSSNQGWDFAEVLVELAKEGYSLWWQVLNAKNFNVPQNRERVFVIGARIGSGQEVFRNLKDVRLDQEARRKNWEKVQSLEATQYKGISAERFYGIEVKQMVGGAQGQRVYDSEGIATTLRGGGGGQGGKTGLYAIRDLTTGDTFGTLRSGGMGGVPSQYIKIPSATKAGYEIAQEGDGLRLAHMGSATGRGRVGHNQAQALVQSGDAHAVQHGQVRRLTPLECERLMSWQDNWTRWGIDDKGNKIAISDSQRYKMTGNGVVSNVVRELVSLMFRK